MKLIVLKVNEDVVNGGALSIIVGVFDDSGGQPLMQFNAPKKNFIETRIDFRPGQELKLISDEAVK